jgi:hypothetical protein
VSAVPFASLTVRMGASCVYTSPGGNGDVTILRRPMRRMKAPQRRGVTLIVAVKPGARFRGEAAEDGCERGQYNAINRFIYPFTNSQNASWYRATDCLATCQPSRTTPHPPMLRVPVRAAHACSHTSLSSRSLLPSGTLTLSTCF